MAQERTGLQIPLSEIGKALAESISRGETSDIVDGETVVARVLPEQQKPLMTPEERIEQLVREGKATRGTGKVPDWFFTAPRPKSEDGSVLEQLLADRRKYDW